MVKQQESQSPLALGIEWASRITTIGLMFALPAMLGYGVDSWLHTTPAGTIAGAGLGFASGMLQTVRMSRQLRDGSVSRGNQSRKGSGPQGPQGTPS